MPIIPWTSKTATTLTGDVTGSGTASIATTIKTNVNLSGSPTTTTQSAGDNSTKISTTAFVTTAVNNAISGVNPAVAVQVATATVLPNSPTYNNGASGVGATLTAGVTNTALVVDGYTPILNDRILVKNQGSAFQNGVYFVSQVATVGLAWILTRALDYDQPSDINNTGAIPVVNGTVNGSTSWVLTSLVTTIGTDSLTYTEFTLNPTTIVVGPASATDSVPALFDGTSGKLIKNSVPTGSGVPVLATSPSLTTPTLGVATVTTINKVTLTTPATGSTLTIADGKTLTANNSLTLAGTDSTIMTFPSSSGTVATLAATQTFTNKRNTPRVNSTSSSATPAINTDTTDLFEITALAAAITSMTTNLSGTPNDGDVLIIRIKDNGTARAITWGTSFGSSGIATLLTTTVINKQHTVGLMWDANVSKWVCMACDSVGY